MIYTRADFAGDVKFKLYNAFNATAESIETVHDKIYNVQSTDAAYEKGSTESRLGMLLERPEGNDIIFEKPTGGLTIYGKIRTFSKGFQMTEEAVEDVGLEGATNKFVAKAQEWGQAYIESKEEYAARPFNYGGFTAGHDFFNNTVQGEFQDPGGDLLWDGNPFFNLAANLRTTVGGQTYYNSHALALTLANLQTMYQHQSVTNSFDEWGNKRTLTPNTILSTGSTRFTLFPILNSQQLPGGNFNDPNPMYKLLNPLEWSYLTDTDAFFMGIAKRGLQFRNRLLPVIDFYQNPINRSFYATCNARWGAWVDDWGAWQASQISTS